MVVVVVVVIVIGFMVGMCFCIELCVSECFFLNLNFVYSVFESGGGGVVYCFGKLDSCIFNCARIIFVLNFGVVRVVDVKSGFCG